MLSIYNAQKLTVRQVLDTHFNHHRKGKGATFTEKNTGNKIERDQLVAKITEIKLQQRPDLKHQLQQLTDISPIRFIGI